jgi:hypothetical protein
MSSYAEQEQDAREYAQLKKEIEEERLLEPTEPHEGGYLLVDDDQIEEPVAFRTIEGATDWCGCYENYTVYKLKKVL